MQQYDEFSSAAIQYIETNQMNETKTDVVTGITDEHSAWQTDAVLSRQAG